MAEKKNVINGVPLKAVHKFKAGFVLICIAVVFAAGIRGELSVTTIVFRAFIVTIVIFIISRIVIQVLKAYQEMSRE